MSSSISSMKKKFMIQGNKTNFTSIVLLPVLVLVHSFDYNKITPNFSLYGLQIQYSTQDHVIWFTDAIIPDLCT